MSFRARRAPRMFWRARQHSVECRRSLLVRSPARPFTRNYYYKHSKCHHHSSERTCTRRCRHDNCKLPQWWVRLNSIFKSKERNIKRQNDASRNWGRNARNGASMANILPHHFLSQRMLILWAANLYERSFFSSCLVFAGRAVLFLGERESTLIWIAVRIVTRK